MADKVPVVFTCGHQHVTLYMLEQILGILNEGKDVTIVNCYGGSILRLGAEMMAYYEKVRDGR